MPSIKLLMADQRLAAKVLIRCEKYKRQHVWERAVRYYKECSDRVFQAVPIEDEERRRSIWDVEYSVMMLMRAD